MLQAYQEFNSLCSHSLCTKFGLEDHINNRGHKTLQNGDIYCVNIIVVFGYGSCNQGMLFRYI